MNGDAKADAAFIAAARAAFPELYTYALALEWENAGYAKAFDAGEAVILELEARVKELEAARVWQPIETAPRDGTRVLLAWGAHVEQGYFLDNSTSSKPWAGWRTESMRPTPSGTPTHWMPLPPPPTETDDD